MTASSAIGFIGLPFPLSGVKTRQRPCSDRGVITSLTSEAGCFQPARSHLGTGLDRQAAVLPCRCLVAARGFRTHSQNCSRSGSLSDIATRHASPACHGTLRRIWIEKARRGETTVDVSGTDGRSEGRMAGVSDQQTTGKRIRDGMPVMPGCDPSQHTDSRMPEKQIQGEMLGMGCVDWGDCPAVERVPGKVSGAWLFRGTGVPVAHLFANLGSGASVEDFVEWFPMEE